MRTSWSWMSAQPQSLNQCTSAVPTTSPSSWSPSTPISSQNDSVAAWCWYASPVSVPSRPVSVSAQPAHVLTGGVNAFADAGGDVVRGAQRWDIERQVRLVAGSLVVTGLVGGKFISPKMRAVAGAIGAGLTFSGVTNTCAMGKALAAMPWNKTTQNLTAAESINQIPTTSA